MAITSPACGSTVTIGYSDLKSDPVDGPTSSCSYCTNPSGIYFTGLAVQCNVTAGAYGYCATHIPAPPDVTTTELYLYVQACDGTTPNFCNTTVNCPNLVDSINSYCDTALFWQARDNAVNDYYTTLDSLYGVYTSTYYQQCVPQEKMTINFSLPEYHYTLYYYDAAGNLVQTVPPEGVLPDDHNNPANPTHVESLKTIYKYNALNQVIWQKTPDAGSTQFWYNRASQLRASQNAKQYVSGGSGQYSITKYDPLGRITEVAQVTDQYGSNPLVMSNPGSSWQAIANSLDQLTYPALDIETNTGTYYTTSDATVTWYDGVNAFSSFGTTNYRGRVTTTWRVPDGYPQPAIPNFTSSAGLATFYQYDDLGNVSSLIQNLPFPCSFTTAGCTGNSNGKRIDYTYDLISGKVNSVGYQVGQADGFYHKYEYDADNRITNVYTSKDNMIWDEDAEYFYYPHGPLARTELGQDKIQGIDYAYTVQGWLKYINAPNTYSSTSITFPDPGADGVGTAGLNKYIPRDEFALALGYYNTTTNLGGNTYNYADYTPIDGNVSFGQFLGGNSNYLAAGPVLSHGLYNGNIAFTANNIPQLDETWSHGAYSGGADNVTAYQYDQLNRITQSKGFSYNTDNTYASNNYITNYTYDQNGNITGFKRWANGYTGSIDDLTYHYARTDGTYGSTAYLANNKLWHVNDDDGIVANTDLGDQGTLPTTPLNYNYDAIGNLIQDNSQGIQTIAWDVYGKIKSISRASGSSADNLNFMYDAMGNRVYKSAVPNSGTLPGDVTYYVRDATGNVMAIYQADPSTPSTLAKVQYPLYGSSRVGVANYTLPYTLPTTSFNRTLNYKAYELNDHLGNVMVNVADWRKGYDNNADGIADVYRADHSNGADYYPFGMIMPGRNNLSSNEYRFGFNGKEKDDEVKGTANSLDFGARIYDSRLGRWLSVDPEQKEYPSYSPYTGFTNNPILLVDQSGKGAKIANVNLTYDTKNGEAISATADMIFYVNLYVDPCATTAINPTSAMTNQFGGPSADGTWTIDAGKGVVNSTYDNGNGEIKTIPLQVHALVVVRVITAQQAEQKIEEEQDQSNNYYRIVPDLPHQPGEKVTAGHNYDGTNQGAIFTSSLDNGFGLQVELIHEPFHSVANGYNEKGKQKYNSLDPNATYGQHSDNTASVMSAYGYSVQLLQADFDAIKANFVYGGRPIQPAIGIISDGKGGAVGAGGGQIGGGVDNSDLSTEDLIEKCE